MSDQLPTAPASPNPEPFPQLLKTRDVCMLWALRIVVRLGGDMDALLRPLDPLLPNKIIRHRMEADSDRLLMARCAATLNRLESRAKPIRLPGTLRKNLDLLRQHFSFTGVECAVLAFAVLLRSDDTLYRVADSSSNSANAPAALARVLGISESKIAKALEPDSALRRSNLIVASSGGDIARNLQLRRGGLRKLAVRKLKSADELFEGILVTSPSPNLLPGDYTHLNPDFPTLCRFIADALAHERIGVNVLLHGAPGTGKSELVRVLARRLQVPLFDVADADEDCDSLQPGDRLARAVASLFLLGRRRAILCFDEVEALFNDGSVFFGKPSTAELQKSFFNRMLEQNQVPVFWIANSIRGIDPAFARRFDLIVNLETPPQSQRLNLLERECGELVSHRQLRRLSRVEHITPAMVTRAAKVVRHTGLRDEMKSERLLETVLDGVLQAQRHAPLAITLRKNNVGEFIPDLCNASENLEILAEGLSQSMSGRICLYGPPGTGKTAFGRWLANRLEKPLLLKRVSDIQSPLLGEMEQNLAYAFACAERDGAILQIDEVDSFLQDRRQAQRHWEISQVNEFLTQLETFDGLFIASTNLMDGLDPAAMRRFDHKIRMDYLRPDQAQAMLDQHLGMWGIEPGTDGKNRLPLQKLTPGDFAVVARRHRVAPFVTAESVVDALCAEAAMRKPATRTIGFV